MEQYGRSSPSKPALNQLYRTPSYLSYNQLEKEYSYTLTPCIAQPNVRSGLPQDLEFVEIL